MKSFKRLSSVFILVLALGIILTSCSNPSKVKEDIKNETQKVEEGAKDIGNNVKNDAQEATDKTKEGLEDTKNGIEDKANDIKNAGEKAVDRVEIIGTWKGTEADGDSYTLNLFADLTYEVIKVDNNNKSVHSGKYSIKGDTITLNREKKMENNKMVNDREIETLKYTLNKDNLTVTKVGESNGITLTKEHKVLDKIIK